jgi:hypothetical protein
MSNHIPEHTLNKIGNASASLPQLYRSQTNDGEFGSLRSLGVKEFGSKGRVGELRSLGVKEFGS